MLLQMLKMKTKRAFTLIELIITLSIISILLLVVKINFITSKNTLALEEVNIVYESINAARNYAISNSKSVKIDSDVKDNAINIKSDKYYFKTIKCKHLKVLDNVSITFNNTGVVKNPNSFNFSHKKINYRISIRPATGFVNLVIEK